MDHSQSVYIVEGVRTPFLKVKQKMGLFSAGQLAFQAMQNLLMRLSIDPSCIDELILGCVSAKPKESNIARLVALRALGHHAVSAWTVMQNCGSGMRAIDAAFTHIRSHRHQIIIAGGVDALSHAPFFLSQKMQQWFLDVQYERGFFKKLARILSFPLFHCAPKSALLESLIDPYIQQSMGQTAQQLAYDFSLSRLEIDTYALSSHKRSHLAQQSGFFKEELCQLRSNQGDVFNDDDGIRADSSLEQLARLRPAFDRFGDITAGNSSQVTDGAALICLASSQAVQERQLKPLARIVDIVWAGVHPQSMGIAPVSAVHRLLQKYNLSFDDIDLWEINEAFSAQVLSCLKAFSSHDFCKTVLNRSSAWGDIDIQRLNVDGGAIALGHPVSASGARIVLHLAHLLRRKSLRRGIATICIGGGQAGALLLENISDEFTK